MAPTSVFLHPTYNYSAVISYSVSLHNLCCSLFICCCARLNIHSFSAGWDVHKLELD